MKIQKQRAIDITGTRQIATRTSGNVTTNYAYDTGRGMLTSIENKAGSTIVSKYEYDMNNRGQHTQVNQSGSAFAAPAGYGWFYNGKGEVIAANHTADTAKNRAYRYDPIGNRLWSTEGNPAATTPPEAPDPLSAAIAEYASNNLNQYTSVTAAPSVVKYTYDANSRRVKSEYLENSVLRQTTAYLYGGWDLVAEYDTGSAGILPALPNRTYLWGQGIGGGVGGLLSIKEGAIIRAYSFDGNGNVSEVMANNAVVAHYEYDPFGNTIIASGAYEASNPWRFSTKPLDSVSSLYYYGYRWYSSAYGRWPNRDPIDEEGFINGKEPAILFSTGKQFHDYAFVSNAPLHKIDKFGLKECATCGPDITNRLNNTLVHFRSVFSSADPEVRKKACDYAFWPSKEALKKLDSWDIFPLRTEGAFRCGDQGEKCKDTVMVDGSCHNQYAVNYVLYGEAARLCDVSAVRMNYMLKYVYFADIANNESLSVAKHMWAAVGYATWKPGKSPPLGKYKECDKCPNQSNDSGKFSGHLGKLNKSDADIAW